jgi:serine protease Do
LAEKLIPCTVGVQIGPAWGSGVIISKDGYVLTAAHVSGQPNRDVTFVFPDGKTKRGKTLGLNRTLDAGLMKINDNKTEFTHAEMAQAGHLKEGQWCVATGHPGGYFPDRKPVLRLGRILFYDREAVTTDCTLVGGDSGGPLFDMEGRVIGINSRISSELKSNMHVPIAAFREDWERMTKAQAWGHFPGQEPFIGVRGEPNVETAKIAHLVSGGPADKAGLKVGDVVKKFNGQDITDFASLTAKVRDCQPTDRVKLTVQRGEEQLDVFVIVGRKGN